jgi:O-antigen ligase
VIERNVWIRIGSALMMIVPVLVALGTGGRGPLIGFIAAALVFVFGLRKYGKAGFGAAIVGLLGVVYYLAMQYLVPVMQRRILEDKDANRIEIWGDLLHSHITWFGRGVTEYYPHNIFLEFLYNYGIIGLTLFLIVFAGIVIQAFRYYNKTRQRESLWVISLVVLQMISQQFSLDIFYGGLWAAIVLPLGFIWDCASIPQTERLKVNPIAARGAHIGFGKARLS